jgi:mannose-1-phosphate guanylyltransferase/mannose-6-phosphate isomerase
MAVTFRAVLLAGGAGTRLWPLSTEAEPKQFLRLWGDSSLLQDAWRRVAPAAARTCVATSARYAARIREELPDLAPEDLLLEPSRRNTAPAILCASMILGRESDDPVVFVPADQTVADPQAFAASLADAAAAAAAAPVIALLGVRPDRPETEYGYLEVDAAGAVPRAVKRFVEKPSREAAEAYRRSGDFLWNAGIFALRPSTAAAAAGAAAPELMEGCRGYLSEPSAEAWERIPAISFDYAVMEKSRNAVCVPCDAGWNDVGSYRALKELKGTDPSGNLVISDRPVVVEGVRDSVVAVSAAGALVFPFSRERELRERLAAASERK